MSAQWVGLFHLRWSVPVLAAFNESGGHAKFVTLQHRLSVSRSSLQRTLAALIEMGWVTRNDGYGHPLRPEYLLTKAGRSVAAAAQTLVRVLEEQGLTEVGSRKWSVPLLLAMSEVPGQFNTLLEAVGEISPRALSQALRDLEEAGWVERSLQAAHPPRWEYRLMPKSRRVVRAALDLRNRL